MARRSSAQVFKPDTTSGAKISTSIRSVLQRLEEDIKTKVLRSAAHAGAIVFYEEMKRRTVDFADGPEFKRGTLHNSIFRYHDDQWSKGWRQRYLVGPNKAKAPHWFNVEYGHMRVNLVVPFDGDVERAKGKVVEGRDGELWIATKERLPVPDWVPAYPYARPTFEVAPRAMKAIKVRMVERIAELRGKAGDATPGDV